MYPPSNFSYPVNYIYDLTTKGVGIFKNDKHSTSTFHISKKYEVHVLNIIEFR